MTESVQEQVRANELLMDLLSLDLTSSPLTTTTREAAVSADAAELAVKSTLMRACKT